MRNTDSRFAQVPRANIRRSRLQRNSTYKTTLNSGVLVPFFLEKIVLPGDTHSVRTTLSIRMSTPVHPVMDNCYLDTYFFAVPYRLVWKDFEEFMGENKEGPWLTNKRSIQEPHLTFSDGLDGGNWPDNRAIGSVYDYMGYPISIAKGDGSRSFTASALPPRGYAKIWTDWFRSEVTDDPCVINLDSIDRIGQAVGAGSYIDNAALGGKLCPVSKFHDYFTSALPSPQYGDDVFLPLNGDAPVVTSLIENENAGNGIPLYVRNSDGSPISENNVLGVYDFGGDSSVFTAGRIGVSGENYSASYQTIFSNLKADLSLATSASINQLRQALALQSFYEKSARYGSRYTELLRGHFGVTSPDSRLQRPEYLGGKRIAINMQQVLQTSATNEVSPQGNTSAFSWTIDSSDSFTYSATEHCMIIGVCCIRTSQSYQYGLSRELSTRDMIDYYFPTFDSIGEQAILNKELYLQGTAQDNEVFGYQEAWAEYRYKPSRITGQFRSAADQSLDSWHYAEKLDSLPTLSSQFMHQSPTVIDRTLAVSSELAPQFIMDVDFQQVSVRPMSTNSIPGLRSFM